MSEQSAPDLLDPYEKLISVEIMGNEVSVPEKNRLLRCFQYLSINTISYGDFCWNGECTNCQVWYHLKGQSEQSDRPALSCRLECEEGMVITRLSRFIELEGIKVKSSSAYLCVPLRLCGELNPASFYRRGAEERRGTQRKIPRAELILRNAWIDLVRPTDNPALQINQFALKS